MVDTVVYAHAVGNGLGKPDRAPFLEAARRLGVCPTQTVFVGDNPVADIAGAARVGMSTICLARVNRESWTSATGADAVVTSMSEVPSVAMGLIDGRRAYVV